MALVIKVRKGESVITAQAGVEMKITVTECGPAAVKLAFDAPDSVSIYREEVWLQMERPPVKAAPDADPEIEEQLKVLTTSPVTGEATKGSF